MIADNFGAQVGCSGVVSGHDGELCVCHKAHRHLLSDFVTESAELAEFLGYGCGNFLGGRTRTVGMLRMGICTARGPPVSPRISGDCKCENFRTEFHITKKQQKKERKIKPVQISRTSPKFQCPCDVSLHSLSLRVS
jgi:hypothetical protein